MLLTAEPVLNRLGPPETQLGPLVVALPLGCVLSDPFVGAESSQVPGLAPVSSPLLFSEMGVCSGAVPGGLELLGYMI